MYAQGVSHREECISAHAPPRKVRRAYAVCGVQGGVPIFTHSSLYGTPYMHSVYSYREGCSIGPLRMLAMRQRNGQKRLDCEDLVAVLSEPRESVLHRHPSLEDARSRCMVRLTGRGLWI